MLQHYKNWSTTHRLKWTSTDKNVNVSLGETKLDSILNQIKSRNKDGEELYPLSKKYLDFGA